MYSIPHLVPFPACVNLPRTFLAQREESSLTHPFSPPNLSHLSFTLRWSLGQKRSGELAVEGRDWVLLDCLEVNLRVAARRGSPGFLCSSAGTLPHLQVAESVNHSPATSSFSFHLRAPKRRIPSLKTVADRVSGGDGAAPPHLCSPNPGRRLPLRASPRPPPDPSDADKPPDDQTSLISLPF